MTSILTLGRRRSTTCRVEWRPTTTWPTRAWRPPSSSPCGCVGPLLLEGEAGVGKTEVAKTLADLERRPAHPAPVLRGHRRDSRPLYEWDYSPPAAAPSGGRGHRHRRRRHRPPRGTSCTTSGSSCGDRCSSHRSRRRSAAGAARSTRSTAPMTSSRPSCSRCSSEYAVTVPELGTFRADRAADRDRHLEPHPRRARRPQAAVPVPLGRAPRLRTGGEPSWPGGHLECPIASPVRSPR